MTELPIRILDLGEGVERRYSFRAMREMDVDEVMHACQLLAKLNGTDGGHFFTIPVAQQDV